MKWIGQQVYDFVATFRSGIIIDDINITTIQSSSESFADNDTSLMTSAAIDDRINTAITAEDLDLTADSGTAAVDLNSQALAVTGGTNVTTSATGQAVTINVDDAFLKNNADDATTGTITSTGLIVDGDKSITPGDGVAIHVDDATITDSSTSASGTASRYAHVVLEGPTLAATNVSVTTTDAATLYLRSAPNAGDNQTITNAYSLWVDAGNVRFDGTGNTVGTITSGVWNGTAIGASYVATLNQDTTGNAATVTTAAGSSDENHVVPFTTTSAGSASLLSDTGILYNPSSNLLTVGDLTVTGTSTTIGTVTSGTWQGTAIASAYLDADTAHISATKQLTHHGIADDIDSDVVYISLLESDAENTSHSNKHLPIIAPAAGKLLKIFVRTTVDQSSETFTWKLYTRTTSQSTNGAAAEIGAQSGAGPTNKTMVTYDFTTGLDSGTNVIAAGDKVQISLEAGDGATANGTYFITCLWEWNLS